MNFLDAVFAGILGYAVWKGYKKGVFASLSSMAGYIAGLLGTFLFYQPFRMFMVEKLEPEKTLAPWVAHQLALPVSSFETRIGDGAMTKALEILEAKKLPDFMNEIMKGYIKEIFNLPDTKGITNIGDGIVYVVSDFLFSAFCLFLLFAGITVLFRIILPKTFKAVSPGPVSFLDKVGGALLGFAGGIVFVTAIIMLLIPVSSLSSLKSNTSPLARQVQDSQVVMLFTTNAPDLLNMFFQGNTV